MTPDQVRMVARFLKSQTTLTLATAAHNGAPRATPLFYLAADGLILYWLSDASSEHSRSVARRPSAAISIYRPADDWKKIRGVQMRGRVSTVSGAERREPIVKEYKRRFRLGPRMDPAIARSTLYRFQPRWVRFMDNSRRFGFRFEFLCKPA